MPLLIVTVPPFIEQAPETPIVTGNPDDAVAATVKLVFAAAVAGLPG